MDEQEQQLALLFLLGVALALAPQREAVRASTVPRLQRSPPTP